MDLFIFSKVSNRSVGSNKFWVWMYFLKILNKTFCWMFTDDYLGTAPNIGFSGAQDILTDGSDVSLTDWEIL